MNIKTSLYALVAGGFLTFMSGCSIGQSEIYKSPTSSSNISMPENFGGIAKTSVNQGYVSTSGKDILTFGHFLNQREQFDVLYNFKEKLSSKGRGAKSSSFCMDLAVTGRDINNLQFYFLLSRGNPRGNSEGAKTSVSFGEFNGFSLDVHNLEINPPKNSIGIAAAQFDDRAGKDIVFLAEGNVENEKQIYLYSNIGNNNYVNEGVIGTLSHNFSEKFVGIAAESEKGRMPKLYVLVQKNRLENRLEVYSPRD